MRKHGNGRSVGGNIVKVRRNENPGCWRSSRRCLHRRLIKPRPELGGGENVLSFIKRVSVNSGQGWTSDWGHVGLTSQWQISNTSQMLQSHWSAPRTEHPGSCAAGQEGLWCSPSASHFPSLQSLSSPPCRYLTHTLSCCSTHYKYKQNVYTVWLC